LENGHELLLKYNNRIRDFFIARPTFVFIDDDYNSLEPRVFSSVAGDEALTNIFKNNEDFYSKIAIMVEGLQNVSSDKSAPNYLGKVNKSARQTAKAYSLGIAYGLDSYKLHKDLNISKSEAESLIKGYFEAFPKLKQWQEDSKTNILVNGKVSTRFGRVRRQPEIPRIFAKHGNAILNALDLWKKYNETPGLYKQAKEDYAKVRHAINNAYNHQIQGLAAHILNRAAIAVAIEYKEKQLDAYIIGCIHDEIIVESSITDRDEAAAILKRCMEQTTIIETPLEAEPSFGQTLKEAKGA
jgi:DNA polymerase-1